jgi:hypothetical protein
MARILINGEWYDEINTAAFYESEFESIFSQKIQQHIQPQFWCSKFNQTVESELGTARADLALVDLSYREWIVVEVELGHHPLEGHVVPQVSKLVRGRYTMEHAENLARRDHRLDLSRLRQMIKGEQPKVLVVTNQSNQSWRNEIERIGASLVTVQMFRDFRDQLVFSIDGSIACLPENFVSYCTPDLVMPNWLCVASPGGLPTPANGEVVFLIDGGQTRWRRQDLQSKVYLEPKGRYPLPNSRRYEIIRQGSDLILRKAL